MRAAAQQLRSGLRTFSVHLCSPTAVLTREQEEDWTCGHENLAAMLRYLKKSEALLPPSGATALTVTVVISSSPAWARS